MVPGSRRALCMLKLPDVSIMELQISEILGYVLLQKYLLQCLLKAMRNTGPEENRTLT